MRTFSLWMERKTDADYLAMVVRGVLSRKEIAKECGFAKSALDQNPRIKAALRKLEEGLRARGVLPEVIVKAPGKAQEPPMRDAGSQRARLDAERLRRLEQENASLRAENAELKRLLSQYALLREALTLTGTTTALSESLLLRVKRVYSQNPRGFGGAIFACSPIDDRGDVLNASSLVIVHASGRVLAGINVQAGQWWEVRGCVRAESVDLNGYRVVEQRLGAVG